MSTRESILALFEEHKGVFFSGEEIAAKLSVSRAAVWKAVNSLRKDGYEITAVSNKGYCLSAEAVHLFRTGDPEISDSFMRFSEFECTSGSGIHKRTASGMGGCWKTGRKCCDR